MGVVKKRRSVGAALIYSSQILKLLTSFFCEGKHQCLRTLATLLRDSEKERPLSGVSNALRNRRALETQELSAFFFVLKKKELSLEF